MGCLFCCPIEPFCSLPDGHLRSRGVIIEEELMYAIKNYNRTKTILELDRENPIVEGELIRLRSNSDRNAYLYIRISSVTNYDSVRDAISMNGDYEGVRVFPHDDMKSTISVFELYYSKNIPVQYITFST